VFRLGDIAQELRRRRGGDALRAPAEPTDPWGNIGRLR
jgi:hypothetical protein